MERKQEGQPGAQEPGEQMPALPEINEVTVVGRLINAPKTRLVAGDRKMSRFMLAVTRSFRNNAGQPSKDTAYVPVVAWRQTAEQAESLTKGDAVRAEGRLRTWQSAEGQKYRWEVEASVLEVLHRRQPEGGPRQEELAGV